LTLEDIRAESQAYLQSLKSENGMLRYQEKENLLKYKKTLAANAIGILDYLYQQERGFIVIENLSRDMLDRQTRQKTAHHRQLERALYEKWQIYGVVPPRLNMPNIWLDFKNYQLGEILLIDENGTSKTCPKCECTNKNTNTNKIELDNRKFNDHQFKCQTCDFDTKQVRILPDLMEYQDLDSPDTVAGYNIAKKGQQFFVEKSILAKNILFC
jgi:hypothetical protein